MSKINEVRTVEKTFTYTKCDRCGKAEAEPKYWPSITLEFQGLCQQGCAWTPPCRTTFDVCRNCYKDVAESVERAIKGGSDE